MDNTVKKLNVGDVIRYDEKIFRILVLEPGIVIMIQLIVEFTNILSMSEYYFMDMLSKGEVKPEARIKHTVPLEKLSDEDMEKANARAEAIERMLHGLYPGWETIQMRTDKPAFKALISELGLSNKETHELVRRYLQSGRDPLSLIDMRKGSANRQNNYEWGDPLRGYNHSNVPNDEKTLELFEKGYAAIMEADRKNRRVSIAKVYREVVLAGVEAYEMNGDGLTVKEIDRRDIISYGRFYRFVINKAGMKIGRYKAIGKSRGNDKRLMLGSSDSGCLGPGHIVEVDEVEIDMYVVSKKDDRRIVGKAIMYAAVDVYSRCIVACWVDFDNNSFVGITNLLMCFLDDPAERFARYGINLDKDVCPWGFIPGEIRADHGSEYTSEDVRRIGRETGMNISLVAPGTGSLKGLVEQTFHQFQERLGASGGEGFVLKRYGSRHYETACTDIEDVRKIAYKYVEYHNRHLISGYKKTKDMMEKGIDAIPYKIWQYGIKHILSPKRITGDMRDRFIFAILKADKRFTISKRGISYRNSLYYDVSEDWFIDMMREAGDKIKTLEGVRYDPRNVDHVYLMLEGELKVIPLNTRRANLATFKDMSWNAYEELRKKDEERKKALETDDILLTARLEKDMENIIDTSKKMQSSGKNTKKDMKAALRDERTELMKDSNVASRLGLGTKQDNQTRPEIPDEEKAKAKPLPDKTVSTVDEEYINALFEEA